MAQSSSYAFLARQRHEASRPSPAVYLHPDRARLAGPGIDVDTDPLPPPGPDE